MEAADKRDLLSVAEVAKRLHLSPVYVVRKLLHTRALGPVFVVRGRRYFLRAQVEAYRRKRRRIARRALSEIARISQEAGLYERELPAQFQEQLIMTSGEELLDIAEAARLLFVSKFQVERLIDDGKLPSHHSSGQSRFVRRSDVVAYKSRKLIEAQKFLETQTEDDESSLTIALYDGKCSDDNSTLSLICDIEGTAIPYGRLHFSALEEALWMLDTCADKYSTSCPLGEFITVLIGRKVGNEATSLARLDVYANNGRASAIMLTADNRRTDTEEVRYEAGDDAVTIVRKILRDYLGRG
jgi:excisionase family DNA binding protein